MNPHELKTIQEKLLELLDEEATKRNDNGQTKFSPYSKGRELAWVTNERKLMFDIVNAERSFRGKQPITLKDICKAEDLAMGHFDYMRQYTFRCAEMVLED